MSSFVRFFDKLEDRARARLSRSPIVYAIIGGIFVVLFWRAVWLSADMLAEVDGWLSILFSPGVSLLLSVLGLLLTGLFVSFFIGDRIILTGLKHEKKLAEKTEKEVEVEEAKIKELHAHIAHIEKRLDDIA
ncbi:MAG: hypothetical protein A3C08_03430 [Candidatus Taylorbacteria bacterium RIFCSPHIGHO2_02_FULL_47_18]|uniref:Uncharacterized protein n=1 Tax=Candidatus Taylorbacteria bacterium RIFCSPLOWO2_01_FULL_48_100 TaxID=1802322 RepID=A0A1G2NFF5_9BACT|nr:MAG: hypothetical protein A3C08_03430 [Candidatus Taylorbacteria bacterium RIFCSPHIGHO2_02_FULL_47_18]OHA34804.1 MAG: hypothetical protein A2938_00025 [Candidatus Taylorbacteria bacterium RIFCSPLOWO2_01_FULL_48_100]OHA41113.1 MAG: hypothetical protein A3J31_03450 [Candidatus Taylorbacteria bacterium RIFCSPLOWO2_02_FULL_48_16]OHA45711.1 MAG: hypothetical protein A3H13_00405 [Candidatus Taylorbacteria bacterium RIFCSPLOWO2_12_FULL_48_11]